MGNQGVDEEKFLFIKIFQLTTEKGKIEDIIILQPLKKQGI